MQNDCFEFIGTPFKAIDYKPVWKQEARNEQGGKRFHGAFTGGFSAGYFNTVGSKEGWTPTEFRSSRTNRAIATSIDNKAYMDEEDRTDIMDSLILSVNEAFKGADDGSVDQKIGFKIMQRLGWHGEYISEDLREKTDGFKEKIPAGPDLDYLKRARHDDIGMMFQSSKLANDLFQFPGPNVPSSFVPRGLGLESESAVVTQKGKLSIEERKAALNEPKLRFKVKTVAEEMVEEKVSLEEEHKISAEVAKKALNGFMPFQNALEKHEAYLKYLQYYAENQSKGELRIEKSWLAEFSKAASIFRPLPAILSSRFTSSSKPGLHHEVSSNQQPTPKANATDVPLNKGCESINARSRQVKNWTPADLLCKRFSVPNPYDKEAKVKSEVKELVNLESVVSFVKPLPSKETKDLEKSMTEVTLDIFVRPASDIFKQIFGDTSQVPSKPSEAADKKPQIRSRPSASDFW